VTLAAFILAIIGTVTGAASLTWNIISFSLQGPRPELTPIVGIRSAGGLASVDARRDVRESLASAARQLGSGTLVIGVKVVNSGRAPFHVAGWALRSDPSATSLTQFDEMLGSPTVSRDIPPGGSETFFTALNNAYALAAGTAIDGQLQRVVVTVSSGGRTYVTEPVASVNLELGAP
jgi:hypothetical protein